MKFTHLLFDLDNTLYPSSSAMDSGITLRMLECVADFFHCDIETAKKLKQENIVHHSTTLEWLRASGLKDIEGFLAHVHPENEADELLPQPGLREFLESLPYSKAILTNAPREHADRVLAKLGITDLFDSVTDIRDANFFGKPYSNSYLAALEKTGSSVENTLFLDDMKKYTDGWCALGGTSILIGNSNGKPLAADAKSILNSNPAKTGKTIKMKSIYELPDFLNS